MNPGPANQNEFGQLIGAPLPGWKAPPVPPHVTLSGRHCRLEPLDAARHARELFEAREGSPDGGRWTYLFSGPFSDFDSFEAHCADLARRGDLQTYAIVDASTGRATGFAAYLRITPEHGVIEVGYLYYSPRLARTVAATEAMHLMMANAFALGYRRYEWKCDALNAPSRAAAQRLGFTFEGLFRQAVVYKGRTRDTAWYAVIDRDWPDLKEVHTQWLDSANFTASGEQRVRLSELTARFAKPNG